MLRNIFLTLDKWILEENKRRKLNGTLETEVAEFRVLGQTALFESKLNLHLIATHDVDMYVKAQHIVWNKLDELLKAQGKHLDLNWQQIWMPEETEYDHIYKGKFVTALIAKPEYILLSKAMKAPEKNGALIVEYLAKGPSKKFEDLVKKYKVDLGQFL